MRAIWEFLTTSANWSGRRGIWARTSAHMWLSLVSVGIASFVAVPLGIWVSSWRRGAGFVAAIMNVGRAIPSFAILALVLPISIRWGFGLGFWPTVVAMVALALPPIFLSTLTGVRTIDPAVRQAAAGMGMSRWEMVRQVEVPLSTPQIITGIRISTLAVIATATLGALVAFSGLGSFIEEGRASFDQPRYLGGAALVVGFALLAESLLLALQHLLAPWARK